MKYILSAIKSKMAISSPSLVNIQLFVMYYNSGTIILV